MDLHKCIKSSGKYNFMGDQVNIKSQLNPEVWEAQLQDYWDTQLPLLIRFGFPLDFDSKSVLSSHEKNHSSANLFPDDIKAYLNEEREYGAILGPFLAPRLKAFTFPQ